jgi:ascorbate-specific PTS system EIIC-type component UlaA
MRKSKIIFAILSAAALLACSVSSADARGFGHRDGGPVADILGGVVVGAVTIATLPFVLLADAAHGGSRRRGYYGADDYAGYGPPPGNYGQEGYGYGPPQGYYDYGPPPPPPPRYYRSYGPPRGYYGY